LPVGEVVHELPVFGVIKSETLIEGFNLLEILFVKGEPEGFVVLSKTHGLGGLDKSDRLSLNSPVDANLGGGFAVFGGDLSDDWFCQKADVLVLIGRSLVVTGADGGVGGDHNTQLLVPFKHLGLSEVGVNLNLVDRRFDLGASDEVKEDGHRAVGDTNRSDLSLLDALFHGFPVDVERRGLDLDLVFSNFHIGFHPVNDIEVEVLEAESLEASVDSFLDIVLIIVPQLRGDENIFTLDASFEGFLETFTDILFVAVDLGAVNVGVVVFDEGSLYHLLNIGFVQVGTQTNGRHLVAGVEFESGAVLFFGLNHICIFKITTLPQINQIYHRN